MRRYGKVDHNQAHRWWCVVCGKEARATAHQMRQNYCSKVCMSKSYKVRMRGADNPNYRNAGLHECMECGCSFQSYNKTRKYCSSGCYRRHTATASMARCPQCNITYKPKRKDQKYCSMDCYSQSRKNKKIKKRGPGRPVRAHKRCEACGAVFKVSPSRAGRKYCSYTCFIDSGGPFRAGRAAVVARVKYGAKKDANHNAIFDLLRSMVPVKDLSPMGYGVPDGIAWIREGWHFFDVKNPETSYGRKGLNKIQRNWADNWQGGPVYLIRTLDEAILFARGKMETLDRYPDAAEISEAAITARG